MIYRETYHNAARKLSNSQGGFTLVELLVVMVIIALLGTMVNSAFSGWTMAKVLNQDRTALQRELDRAVNKMVLDLQGGVSATIASYGGGTDNSITVNVGGTNVVFRSNPAVSPVPLECDGTNIIKDYMNAGIEVDNLSFTSTTVGTKQSIEILLSLKYTNDAGHDEVVEFRTSTILRNS